MASEKLTKAMVDLLTAISGKRHALRHNAEEKPAWWLEGGFGVNAHVARAAVNKGYAEKTTGWPDLPKAGCYSITEAGRQALAQGLDQGEEKDG